MNKFAYILLFLGFSSLHAFTQEPQGKIVIARIVDGDTVITYNLPEYMVSSKLPRKLRSMARKNSRLVYNVKKVYPYAKLAGIKLNEYGPPFERAPHIPHWLPQMAKYRKRTIYSSRPGTENSSTYVIWTIDNN